MKYALVVDDQAFTRKIIRQILEDLAYEVLEAADGQEAVEIFQQAEKKLDLITMDFNMPIKNGVEAVKEIRQINKIIPIIGISAAASVMRSHLKYETKISVLDKPVDKLALEAAIMELDINES
jgi:two-component system, sensor histidine kinase